MNAPYEQRTGSQNLTPLDPRKKNREYLAYLSQFVSPQKQGMFDEVLVARTRHLTVVLEDVYRPHNAGACLRSCEAAGLQDVHIVENRYQYQPHKDVTRGAQKWLTITRYQSESCNTRNCLSALREQGYRILAAVPDPSAESLETCDLSSPTAVVFGTEMEGISETAREMADGYLQIPMYGFTRSYNVSVAVALCTYTLAQRVRQASEGWQLTPEEQFELRIQWTRQAVCRWLPQLDREYMRFLDGDRSDLPTNGDHAGAAAEESEPFKDVPAE